MAYCSLKNEKLFPKEMKYSFNLRRFSAVYQIKEGVFALPDCEKDGKIPLNPKYVIVERVHIQSKVCVHMQSKVFSICSCNTKKSSNILDALKIHTSVTKDSTEMCIHAVEAETLGIDREEDHVKKSEENFGNNKEDVSHKIWHLNTSLICVYCNDTHTYGILSKTAEMTKCFTCKKRVTKCCHVLIYNKNKSSNEQTIQVVEPLVFTSVSSNNIPLPYREPPKQHYPKHIVPKFNPVQKCTHGHLFNADDPISSKWVQNDQATIYLDTVPINCVVYYRPSINSKCGCRQFADGFTEQLLNLDNEHLFPYSWLIDIMSKQQEMKMSLRAVFRAAQRTAFVFGQTHLQENMYEHLRNAYNCFLQLIDLN